MNTILTDQLSEKLQRPLLAQRNAYSKAKRIYLIEGVIILNAIVGTIFIPLHIDLKEPLAIISVFGAIALLTISSLLGKQTKDGAALQEYFDVELFKIDWNKTLVGKRPKINDQFFHLDGSEKPIKGWYSERIKPSIPHNIAVILCYKCNTVFALFLRTRYLRCLYSVLVGYYLTYIILVLVYKISLYDLAIYLAPSIPFLNLMMNKIKSHNSVCQKYKDIDDQLQIHIDNYKENKTLPTNEVLRRIQDLNFLLRLIPTKIPNCFYTLKNENANKTTDKCIDALIEELNLAGPVV